MKVYIGYDGEIGKQMARILKHWLDAFFQGKILVFLAHYDTAPGNDWSDQLQRSMQEADYALLCVTGERVHSPWLYYEAGMLYAHNAIVIPVLFFGVSHSVLDGPLGDAWAVTLEHDDMYKLVNELQRYIRLSNAPQADRYGHPLSASASELRKQFEIMYPALKKDLYQLREELKPTGEQRHKGRDEQEDSLAVVNRKLDSVLSTLAAMSKTPDKKNATGSHARLDAASSL